MTLFDHLLAIVLVVVGPLLSATLAVRPFRDAAPDELPDVRRRAYRNSMLTQWLRVLATLVLWWKLHRPLADLGLDVRFGGGFVGIMIGLAVIVYVMVRQRRVAFADEEALAQIRARLGNVQFLLPHTRAEFAGFVPVAITAGLCEELLYRGYLIWYFSHLMPWWLAGILAAVAFGFGHVYQGARGVMVTSALGLFLGAVYFVSGSLLAPMLIHVLMDLHTGDLAWRAYERRPRAVLPGAGAADIAAHDTDAGDADAAPDPSSA